jgi:hypothetical protein
VHGGTHFLAGGASGHDEASAGDHLQTLYRLWLTGHQLERGQAPWLDPYSFQPEAGQTVNASWWPFGLAFWPLVAIFGSMLAWNLFVLLTFVAAGGATCAWLRELGLPRGPAFVGGLAFAVAPYRVAQSAGHLLGPISLLLPLALWAFERGRRGSRWWLLLAGVSLVSIPLSGQVHLALGAIPFFALYVLCRTRDWRVLAAAGGGVAAAVGAGVLIRETVIAGSLDAGGRNLSEVARYSASSLDFITRHQRHGVESFVFVGWLTPLLAIAGLVLLLLARRWTLAVALGIGALVPVLLAFGTHFPLYSPIYHVFPPLRYPRVPERLMPIACLAIAGLVAFAIEKLVRGIPRATPYVRYLLPLAVVVLLADLHTTIFKPSSADAGNRAYAAIEGPGRVLELPVWLPDVHLGSVYLYYDMQALRERPGGYSTTAPLAADSTARSLRPLNCGDWTGGQAKVIRELGVQAIVFHAGLYKANALELDPPWFAWRELLRHGYRPYASDGPVTLFETGAGRAPRPAVPEPSRDEAVFCEGWYPADGAGRLMSQGHSPVWIYGGGTAQLIVRARPALPVRISVDGRQVTQRRIGPLRVIRAPLGGRGWHLVAFDAHLVEHRGHLQGARLVAYALD